jgi:type IV pilus assembly protein PilY1
MNNDGDDTNDEPSIKGGSIDIIDADDGTLLKRFDNETLSGMGASIISAFAVNVVESAQPAVTQIYAADLEGHVFGFRDNNPEIDGNWQNLELFEVTGTSIGKKIFSELDFVQEYLRYYDTKSTPETNDDEWITVTGDYTYFGTGDREDPLDLLGNQKVNYFYCVKNDWITDDIKANKVVSDFETLDDLNTEDDDNRPVMVDLTNNNITDEMPEDLQAKYNRGWYIKLEGDGEKCLSTPLVYEGVVYFTTYMPPDSEVEQDPCSTSSAGGTARLYALNYKTGAAVYHFSDPENPNPDDPLTKDDRFVELTDKNITIPPDPVIIITDKGDKLLIGTKTFDIKSHGSGIRSFYWKG